MPRIAISYRRSDSAAISGRIADRLVAHYGGDSVFMDIDSIPIGTDFRSHIQKTLQRADVLIAVIGPGWRGSDGAGGARICEEKDPVRVEIETALARKMSIIPVLVDGVKMPDSSELPAEFGDFPFLNATEVASGRDFHMHVDRLIQAIDRLKVADAEAAAFGAAQSAAAASLSRPDGKWIADAASLVALPLVLLLVAHHLIVNALDLNTIWLRAACALVPFVFGFMLARTTGRGVALALAFSVALGITAAAGMTISEGLNSGQPIMPQTRFEWRDTIEFAATIALAYAAGYAASDALRAWSRRKIGRR
jgi:hypothetical protein